MIKRAHRLFVRKRPNFQVAPFDINDLKMQLGIPGLTAIERINIYDLFNVPESQLSTATEKVFCDPITDIAIKQLPPSDYCLVVEPLPGQFDQRADSAEQCLKLLSSDFEKTQVTTAIAYLFQGKLSENEQKKLQQHFINPIESRLKDLKVQALPKVQAKNEVPIFTGFIKLDEKTLKNWYQTQQLAMTFQDLKLIQNYFKSENRDPSETEISVLDTYWSDHCRHTTFATKLENITFPQSKYGQVIQADFINFINNREAVYGEKAQERPVTLMELATVDAKYQKKQGNLDQVEFSAEVNACSVFIDVDFDQDDSEKWLLQFKNETHNHPTEIEPYGGASTCIGGAIRDPLSGRAYVYQAMRLSGSADPREAIQATLTGKLPQKIIAERSAAGSSAYGNQIGLATGQVVEVYHQGYKAKHLEVGAVVAATPASHVRREEPSAGDLILLLGGATGRDGCGGATGSSKEHTHDSLTESAAEVQKGNPPEERKLQRLFRKKAFTKLIKRCNDFGAGGVAVAIGELADGLNINLDAVPVKYQGLSGTELAISESQERMAIVIEAKDLATAQQLAIEENLTATLVAEVTDDNHLTMNFRNNAIVRLSRDFLESNGAESTQESVILPEYSEQTAVASDDNWASSFKKQLQDIRFADQKGLGDRFDFNVGASCVLLPYGGSTTRTPSEASVYLLPTEKTCNTASILSYGFNADISDNNPYIGGLLAVVEATTRYSAVGGKLENLYFSLQEYFPKLSNDPHRWGLPLAALLGAHHSLNALSRAAIGGKDSMSGSYNQLDVPATLITFAVGNVEKDQVISSEFKASNHYLYLLACPNDEFSRPDFSILKENIATIEKLNDDKAIQSIRAIRHGGLIQALYESALGNNIGADIVASDLFSSHYGAFLISSEHPLPQHEQLKELGKTIDSPELKINQQSVLLSELYQSAQGLNGVYPLDPKPLAANKDISIPNTAIAIKRQHQPTAPVKVCVPVFPGTNSEIDVRHAFERENAQVIESVIKNQTHQYIGESLVELANNIKKSQIFVLSGGFSAGDEPDGSGKFIANILNQPLVSDAINELLARDGLILGICNGFQALIKSGLLTYGEVRTPEADDPTLIHNIGQRHIARIVQTKIVNNHSPWLNNFDIGDIHDMPISHGEGRFYASESALATLIKNGQIATQYANSQTGNPASSITDNPNGSSYAIEGITSPCGKIFGKMGHNERYQQGIYRNFGKFRYQNIFKSGIDAFK